MNLVVGFAPFILFALLSRLSADLALWVAFAAAFVVTIRDFVESPSLQAAGRRQPCAVRGRWRWGAAFSIPTCRWRWCVSSSKLSCSCCWGCRWL